jgi:hypothetical protein
VSLLKLGTIQKGNDYGAALIKFIESSLFFDRIDSVLRRHPHSPHIANSCFDILAYLQDYGIPYLGQALRRADLLATLEGLPLSQGELARKRDILVEYILGQGEGEEL